MKQNDTARLDHAKIDAQRLLGQEVRGDAVGGERIDDEQVELSRRLAPEHQPRVAHDDANVAFSALLYVAETRPIEGECQYLRVDLEVREGGARGRLGSDRPGAESHDTEIDCTVAFEQSHRLADRGRRRVIQHRPATLLTGSGQLGAV